MLKKLTVMALALIIALASVGLPSFADSGADISAAAAQSGDAPGESATQAEAGPGASAGADGEDGVLYDDAETALSIMNELPATITAAQAVQAGHVMRLKAEEPDLNTVVFKNGDGTRTAYQYAVPVKYVENGEIKDKSSRLVATDKGGYAYENEANEVKTYFPQGLGEKGARLEYGGYALELTPVTAETPGVYSAGSSLAAGGSVLRNVTEAADGMNYAGALGEGISLRYTPTLTGLKEDIILDSYTGRSSFSFRLRTEGLELCEISGNWYLSDPESGEIVVELGEIYIHDSYTGNVAEGEQSAHEAYGCITAETIEEGEEYILSVHAPAEYLSAPGTVYPVYIDPTFNVVNTYIQDTHISSGYPSRNYNTASLLNLGYGSSSKSTRILAKVTSLNGGELRPGWPIGTFPDITSATYHMYCTSSYTSNPYVDVYRVKNSWSNTGATWSNASSSTLSGATLVSSTRVGNKGWYEFDITSAYDYWCTVGVYNYGLLFKMRVESASENYWRQFASATYSDSSKLPYVKVIYDEPVSIEINPEAMRLYVGETYRPTVSAEPAGAALGTAYWSSSNTNVVTVNSTTGSITAVSSGTATVTVVINTGAATATGTCSVSVFSGIPPVVMGEVYHIFNSNSTKPISTKDGNAVNNGQVWQESYRPENVYHQKWEVIRLFNGYYVIRSTQNSNMALSGSGDLLQLRDVGLSNNYSDVPTHAQWTISGSAGSDMILTCRSSGERMCIEGDVVWSSENILVSNSVGSNSLEFRFIKPSQYVPTTGVTLKEVYLLKNGSYICMPQITPSNATFKSVIWSWESRGSTTDTGITMTNYDWGTSTASYTGTVVKGLKEGTYWLRAYCSDTNYNDTKDVNVHFLESGPYYFKNRESNKYMSVEGHSQADGAQIIQESFKGEVWQEFYLSRDFMTGYITIKNRHSGKYLSVLNNSGEHDTDIKQDSLPTAGNISSAETGQQFKIERISGEDTIKIIPRTGEGFTPQRVVCVANYVTNSDGVHVKQRDFGANDNYYRDEWYVHKFDASSELGIFIINFYKLYKMAEVFANSQSPAPDLPDIDPEKLTLQYIRRGVYNSDYQDGLNMWFYATGEVDESFINYIKNRDLELHNYFNHSQEWLIDISQYEEIDITHWAATYNGIIHNSFTFMYEDEVDDLCGWGGDLRQSVPIIMRDINYSNDYNTVYNATYNYIGNGKYFNMPDLLADIDAYNMDNMPYSMSIGDKLVDYYYNNGYIKRFTNFIGTQSYMDIYNRSKRILTMTELEWVWAMEKAGPDDKSTGESLVLTDNQIDAICAAYATYLMDQAKSE